MSARTPDFDPGERVPPRPARRLRRGARAVLAVVIALGVALPIVAGVVTLPVQSVRISGEFVQVSRADIERVVEPLLAPGLVRIDVDALRQAAMEVPGVREAKARRVWPGRLDISVIERAAVARWASGGYLGRDGTHFTPAAGGAAAGSLPVLAGPEGSQRRVLDLHIALERVLVPLGMPLAATELTERGVLYATLHGGPRLVMRPAAIERNVATHSKALARVMAGRYHEIERVDLRYPSGFAVRMRTDVTGSEVQG